LQCQKQVQSPLNDSTSEAGERPGQQNRSQSSDHQKALNQPLRHGDLDLHTLTEVRQLVMDTAQLWLTRQDRLTRSILLQIILEEGPAVPLCLH
jgi:hypothetical protein